MLVTVWLMPTGKKDQATPVAVTEQNPKFLQSGYASADWADAFIHNTRMHATAPSNAARSRGMASDAATRVSGEVARISVPYMYPLSRVRPLPRASGSRHPLLSSYRCMWSERPLRGPEFEKLLMQGMVSNRVTVMYVCSCCSGGLGGLAFRMCYIQTS
jgi:hypothetical protein